MRDALTIRLKKQIDNIDALKKGSPVSPDFLTWRKETEELLKGLFGEDSPEVRDFSEIYYTPVFLSCRMDDETFEDAFRKGIEEAGDLLNKAMATCEKQSAG